MSESEKSRGERGSSRDPRDGHRRSKSREKKSRKRDRSGDRDRGSSRDRHRSRDRRRRDDSRDRRRRSSSRDRERSRNKEREHRRERNTTPTITDDDGAPRAPTLKEIIAANPGISVTEALQRLQAINMANEMSGGSLLGLNPSAALQMASNITGGYNINSTGNKLAREVYIGNLPPNTQIPALTEFINNSLKQLGFNNPLGSVVTAWVSTDGKYAFIEFRSIEETTAALNHLGGVNYCGMPLRIGRPKTPTSGTSGTSVVTGVPLGIGSFSDPVLASNLVIRSADLKDSKVMMISNLSPEVELDQLLELVTPFGEVTSHNLIPTPRSLIVEYATSAIAESAVAALHQIFLYDRKITSHRVPVTMSPTLLTNKQENVSPNAPPSAEPTAFTTTAEPSAVEEDAAPTNSPPISQTPTPILRLEGMIGEAELLSEDSYVETLEDIAEEINKTSTIIDITIPKAAPTPPQEELQRLLLIHRDGVGYVYLKFTTAEAAAAVKKAVEGRLYNGRKVSVAYYNPEMYNRKEWC